MATLNTDTHVLTFEANVEENNVSFLELQFATVTQESMTLQSEITDHLVEDNTYIQDHIAIKPVTYTLKGLIGEKIYKVPDNIIFDRPETLVSKLNGLSVFFPQVSSYINSAIQAYNTVNNNTKKIFDAINNVKDTYQYLKSLYKKENILYQIDIPHAKKWSDNYIQAQVLYYLAYMQIYRIPVQVHTGWGGLITQEHNYYITNVSVEQGNTYQMSNLSVTIKEIRTISTYSRKFNYNDYENLNETATELGQIGQDEASENISTLYKNMFIKHYTGMEVYKH